MKFPSLIIQQKNSLFIDQDLNYHFRSSFPSVYYIVVISGQDWCLFFLLISIKNQLNILYKNSNKWYGMMTTKLLLSQQQFSVGFQFKGSPPPSCRSDPMGILIKLQIQMVNSNNHTFCIQKFYPSLIKILQINRDYYLMLFYQYDYQFENVEASFTPYFYCVFYYSWMTSPTKFVRYESSDTLTVQKTSINTTFSLVPPQKIVKQCRICLEDEHEASHKKFIIPCKCTGSVKHIHEECMRKWIHQTLKKKSRQDQQKIKADGIQCEMCKYPIKFQMQSRYTCVNCEQLGQEITKKSLLFAVVFILFLVATGGFSFSLYSVVLNSGQFTDKTEIKFQAILSICGAILLFLFAALALYTLVGQFLIYQILTVGKISQLNSPISRSRNQILPVEDISDQNIEISN